MGVTATVTPGKVFVDEEKVTLAKLNLLGNPTVTLSSDPDAAEVNFFRNGNFITASWISPSGIVMTAGTGMQNAYYWKYRPTGANAYYRRSSDVPDDESLWSAEIEGAASVTTGEFYQEVSSNLAGAMRRQVTFSCWVQNETGAAFTPLIEVNTADSRDSFSSTTQVYSANLQECNNTEWTQVSKTVDLSAYANIENGIEVVVKIPSGSLDSTSKKVQFSRMKIQPGGVVTDFVEDTYLEQTDFDTSGNAAVIDQRDVWLFN